MKNIAKYAIEKLINFSKKPQFSSAFELNNVWWADLEIKNTKIPHNIKAEIKRLSKKHNLDYKIIIKNKENEKPSGKWMNMIPNDPYNHVIIVVGFTKKTKGSDKRALKENEWYISLKNVPKTWLYLKVRFIFL